VLVRGLHGDAGAAAVAARPAGVRDKRATLFLSLRFDGLVCMIASGSILPTFPVPRLPLFLPPVAVQDLQQHLKILDGLLRHLPQERRAADVDEPPAVPPQRGLP
jgi:hypothetical protein